MKLSRRTFIGSSVAVAGALTAPLRFADETSAQAMAPVLPRPARAKPVGVIAQALSALDRHAAQISNRDRLGIADFSAPSGEYRFHIVDVAGATIIHSLLVAHGKGSDPTNCGIAERFSNRPGSNASSLGSFATGVQYFGEHGNSRRLHGLDDQNNRAFERAIVIHGASYVDPAMARLHGRVGRSLGCFAFEKDRIADVLDLLGPGRLLFASDQTTGRLIF